MAESVQTTREILPVQAKCLQNYGCFVIKLCRCESMPVGHLVTVVCGDLKEEVIVVAIQEVPDKREDTDPDKQDLYVLALKEQVTEVESGEEH